MGHGHHEPHGHLADVDEGKSLLPQIVQKEAELQKELEKAQADAAGLIEAAKKRRDEAVEATKKAIPTEEETFVKGQLADYDKELQTLEKNEKQRISTLRVAAEKKCDEAAKAVAQLTLKFGN